MIDFREYLLGILALSKKSTLEIVELACKVTRQIELNSFMNCAGLF